MDVRTLANEILKALREGQSEPKHTDFNITKEEFGKAVEYLEEEQYIRGSSVLRSGSEHTVQIVWLNRAKITEKGYKLLDVI